MPLENDQSPMMETVSPGSLQGPLRNLFSSEINFGCVIVAMVFVLMGRTPPATAADPLPPAVDLRDSLKPSPIKALESGSFAIRGTSTAPDGGMVHLRVTTSTGAIWLSQTQVREGQFSCRYPTDFPGAPPLTPLLAYVDATNASEFDGPEMLDQQAEILLIVSGREPHLFPDLPQGFSDDFLDAEGRKDHSAAHWEQHRTLANRFMHSRAARIAGIGRADFDLGRPEDFAWFKNSLTLYDFDHRDRDWSTPLGHRVARGYWQAVWNTWFGPGNNHPWDGDPQNNNRKNYRPYTFTNDLADLLVLHQMRRRLPRAVPDHRDGLCEEALANLLALQHHSPDNFALVDSLGRQEHYTAGAFRYGLFETGEWLTEGRGWFANPNHDDYRRGGVFNGRAVWALGESIKAEPHGMLASRTREALSAAARYCLHDAIPHGYARELRPGQALWRDPGEHGYLLLGLLAACEVDPELPINMGSETPQPLKRVCADALDTFLLARNATGTWTRYPNQDAIAMTALTNGAEILRNHPHREHWLTAATVAADDWLQAKADVAERSLPTPHFGFRKGEGMTHFMGSDHRVRVTLYVAGHWIHALAKLHQLTGQERYLSRATDLLASLCGDNPFHARLLNELGAVHNFIRDTDGNGIEDALRWDAYPESSAFVQIGLLHLLTTSSN